MKINPLPTLLLIASAATSKNQVEAGSPLGKFVAPVSRGFLTGAISTGVKNIVSGLRSAVHENASIEYADLNSVENSQINIRHSTPVKVKKAIRNFPGNFGSNAVATAYVDKIFGVTKKATVKNLRQLILPVACTGIIQEVLSEVPIPRQLKDTLSYCAFLAGSVAQGKAPVSTGLAISGFAAGASIVRSFGNNGGAKAIDSKKNVSNESLSTPGVSASAASGFMAPESSKTSDGAAAGSYDDYLRKKYGMKEGEKFWEGPDGSIFVPLPTP